MLGSISTVLTGTFVAQLISLASLPILSRVFEDQAFGRYQFYISIANILLMLSTLRYEVGMLAAPKGWIFRNLFKTVLCLTVLTAISAVIVLAFFYPQYKIKYPELVAVCILLPVGMFVGGLLQAFSFLPIRDRNYKLSAISKIVQSSIYGVSGIVMAFSPLSGLGLIFADIFGRACSATVIFRASQPVKLKQFRFYNWASAKIALFRFRKFPKFTLPGTLLSSFVAATPTAYLLMSNDFSVAGQYGLVERFILLPIGTIGFAITQVFTGESASKFREDPSGLNKSFRTTIAILAGISIVPCAVGFFTAQSWVPLVFGDQWELAGKMCSFAMIVAFCSFVTAPVNMLLIVCDRQQWQFLWDVGRFILYISVFFLMWFYNIVDPLIIVQVHAFLVFGSYLAHLLLVDRITLKLAS